MTPRPDVGSVAEELYARMAPLAFADEGVWHMLLFMQAVGGMLQEIEDHIRDTPDRVGYGLWMDPDTVPLKGLWWLGQFVGVRKRPNLTEAEARAWVKGTDGFRRGSTGALREAARRYLIGPSGNGSDAYVIINERVGTDAYALAIRTLTSQTPDAAQVEDAIRTQVPGGIILDYDTIDEQEYSALVAFDTYADLLTEYNTYETLLVNLPA